MARYGTGNEFFGNVRNYFQAFAKCITDELAKFDEDVRDDVVILFSAHSLPMKVRTFSDLFC